MRKVKVAFDNDKLNYSSELMRALAHPLRMKILKFIDDNDVTNVNSIYNSLKLEQSITSQHLRILKLAGVVKAEKEGKYMHYTINYDVVERAHTAVNRFLGKMEVSV